MGSPLSLFLAAPFAVGPLPAPQAPAITGSRQAAPQAVLVESPSGAVVAEAALFAGLASAHAVYVGEKHDDALHHQVQLAVLKGLHARRPGLVVGLEMVDGSGQASLDDWSAGRMSDTDFEAFWKKAWGYDFALYEPILRYAKGNGIPLKGLNAPISLISKIYKGGLASLSPAERARLPARVEQTSDADYLAYITRTIDESHGHPPPDRLAKMLAAQAAWNETMGDGVARLLAGGAEAVLVVAGAGHVYFGAGIAESAARRGAGEQAVVLPWPDGGGTAPLADMLRELRDPARAKLKLARYFWLLPS